MGLARLDTRTQGVSFWANKAGADSASANLLFLQRNENNELSISRTG